VPIHIKYFNIQYLIILCPDLENVPGQYLTMIIRVLRRECHKDRLQLLREHCTADIAGFDGKLDESFRSSTIFALLQCLPG
jgi:hypothetical protein